MLRFVVKLNGLEGINVQSWISTAFFACAGKSLPVAFVFAVCNFILQTFINISQLYRCRVRFGGGDRK